MRNTVIIFITCLFLLYSCKNTEQEQTCTLDINVDKCINESVSINEIFDEISLIQIDSGFLISNPSYMGSAYYTYGKEHFFILDVISQKIHIVDSEGKYITTDNHVGRGPGEYTLARQIQFDDMTGLVNVLDPRGRILQYEMGENTLNFVNQISFLDYQNAAHNFHVRGNDCILSNLTQTKPLSYLNLQSGEYMVLDYEIPQWYFDCWYPRPPFFEWSDIVCYLEYHDGTIHSIDKGSISPMIFLDFGKSTCKIGNIPTNHDADYYREWIANGLKYVLPIFAMVRLCDTLLALCIYRGDTCAIVYDLASGKHKFFHQTLEGLRFEPGIIVDGAMYSFVDCSTIHEYLNPEYLDSNNAEIYHDIVNNEGCGFIRYKL